MDLLVRTRPWESSTRGFAFPGDGSPLQEYSVALGSVAVAVLVTFFATSAFAQSPPPDPNSGQTASATPPQTNNERYRDGMVIWETDADARVPFLLKFNINTQLRYLNTQDSDETFTDHLGV